MKTFVFSRLTVLALLIGLTLGVTQTAPAQVQYGTFTVPRGGTKCISVSATYKIYASGNARPGVKFYGTSNGNMIYPSPSDTTTAYAYQVPSGGFYQLCAQNKGTGDATVTLRLYSDSDAPY